MPFEREHWESQSVTITLREFSLSFWFEEQWQVSKLRHSILPSEGPIEQHMQRRRRQPFLTPDDMRHLHEMVVHDVCQMICREFVSRLIEHLIVKDVRLDAYHAPYEVIDNDFLSWIDKEAHHILLSLIKQLLHFFPDTGKRNLFQIECV